MSIKCAHCGGRHAKLETVRQCAADAGVAPVLPKRDIWLPTLGPMAPVRHRPGYPPPGYYWLEGNIVAKIRVLAEGRWKGRYFVSACSRFDNTEKSVFAKSDRDEFLRWLFRQQTTELMVRYGAITGYCSACGGRLSIRETKNGYHSSNGPYGLTCVLLIQGKYTVRGA